MGFVHFAVVVNSRYLWTFAHAYMITDRAKLHKTITTLVLDVGSKTRIRNERNSRGPELLQS